MTTLMTSRHATDSHGFVDEDGFDFDFPGMTSGQEYTVKLLLGDVRARAHRDTLLHIDANGAIALRHGAIVSAASPRDGVARVSFVTAANDLGQICVHFSDGFSHKQVLGVEILTGKHMPPAVPRNVVAFAGPGHTQIRWTPVEDVTSYTIKRRSGNHGVWHVIATDIVECRYSDITAGDPGAASLRAAHDQAFQYTVVGVNSLGEGEPAHPATALPPFQVAVTPQSFQMIRGQNMQCGVLVSIHPDLEAPVILSAISRVPGIAAWFDRARHVSPGDAGRPESLDRLHVGAEPSVSSGRHELIVRAHSGDFSLTLPVFVTVL